MGIFTEYRRRYGGKVSGAAALAEGLMAGDPARFRAGYSAENAALATRDAAERDGTPLTEDEFGALKKRLARGEGEA